MKYIIRSVWEDLPKEEYREGLTKEVLPFTHCNETGKIIKNLKEVFTIKFNTLDEFMIWRDKLDREIIVYRSNYFEEYPEIEIYDTYRE